MLDVEGLRALARSLPEVEEYDHGDRPAFRVRGRRFATMLDAEGVNLMLGEDGIRAALALWPEACREVRFGARVIAVRVAYPLLPAADVGDLVEDAWARRAPRRLVEQLATSRRGV
jgi:hypothetical protein